MISRTIDMEFNVLDCLKDTMSDNLYVEYIFHKLFDDPLCTWEKSQHYQPTWQFPECWRARYWLYFHKHKSYLQDAHVLDLGSNMNFYGVWSLLNGARHVTAVEPDILRAQLGDEYVSIRNMQNQFSIYLQTLQQFLTGPITEKFDVVFLLDVIYYLTNAVDILQTIKDKVGCRYLFLESSVAHDHSEHGHYQVWYPSTDPKKIQTYQSQSQSPMALMPSRKALYNTIMNQGWDIIAYYDYSDFLGHGESPPRRQGQKDFYLLSS